MGAGQFYPQYCRRLGFFDVAVHGDDVYFANAFFSALIHYSLNSQKFDYVCHLPVFQHHGYMQYGPIAYTDGKLVIGARDADFVLIYDSQRDEIVKQIFLDHAYLPGDLSAANFSNIVLHDGCAYLLPGRCMAIMRIDLATYEVSYLTDWFREVDGDIDEGLVHFLNASVVDGNLVILPTWQHNKIIFYNLQDRKYTVKKMPQEDMYLSCAEPYGESLLLGLREKKDIYLMMKDGSLQCFSPNNDVREFKAERGYKKIYISYNTAKAYLAPIDGNMALCFDLKTGRFSKWRDLKIEPEGVFDEFYRLGKNNLLCAHVSEDGKAFTYNAFDGMMGILDLEKGAFRSIPAELPLNQVGGIAEYERNRYFSKPVIENDNLDIIEFIDFLNSERIEIKKEVKNSRHKICGEVIYNTVMK